MNQEHAEDEDLRGTTAAPFEEDNEDISNLKPKSSANGKRGGKIDV